MERLRRVGLAVLLVLLATGPARAQRPSWTADEFKEAITTLIKLAALVDAADELCSELAPGEHGMLRERMGAWQIRNGMGAAYDLLEIARWDEGLLSTLRGYRKLRGRYLLATYREAKPDPAGWCRSFAAKLDEPRMQLAARNPRALEIARRAVERLGDGERALPPGRVWAAAAPPDYAEAARRGLRPESELLPGAFACYREKNGRDYRWPELQLEVLPGMNYRSSFGDGRYGLEVEEDGTTVRWRSGPFAGEASRLAWDRYGQSFELGFELGEGSYTFHCFQRGASERRALTWFALRDPKPGSFTCRSGQGGDVQELVLLPLGRYRFAGREGEYAVRWVLGEAGAGSSRITWVSGPLAQKEASRYREEAGTGRRTLEFTTTTSVWGPYGGGGSSSSLDVVCRAQGEPLRFERFDAGKAPPPPAGAGGLQGFYYAMEDRTGYWRMESVDAPVYLTFFKNGYVYRGEPEGDPDATDCGKLLPNGAPLCAVYTLGEGTIRFGEDRPVPFTRKGDRIVVEGRTYRPVPRPKLQKLDGTFVHTFFEKWGTFDWGGSYYLKETYVFTRDGRFRVERSDQSTNTFSASGFALDHLPSTYARSDGSSRSGGSYAIEGYVITFRFADGHVERRFIWVENADRFYMGGVGYARGSD